MISETAVRREIDRMTRADLERKQRETWQRALAYRMMHGQYQGAPDPEPCERCFIRHNGECY